MYFNKLFYYFLLKPKITYCNQYYNLYQRQAKQIIVPTSIESKLNIYVEIVTIK